MWLVNKKAMAGLLRHTVLHAFSCQPHLKTMLNYSFPKDAKYICRKKLQTTSLLLFRLNMLQAQKLYCCNLTFRQACCCRNFYCYTTCRPHLNNSSKMFQV